MHEIALEQGAGKNISDSYFIGRDYVLSRAITAIDGQPIALVLGTNDKNAVVQLIEDMEDQVVEYIHDAYLQMLKDNKKKFVIENVAQAQEVIGDLKK